MEFVTLEKEEFEKFSKQHKQSCYLQSIEVATLRKKTGWDSVFLGVKEDGKLLAATLLLSKKRHIKKEFYAIRGPLVDFEDKELLTFFINNLKSYVKENDGYFLRIDPYFEAVSRDQNGEETEEFDHRGVKDTLRQLGFIEQDSKEITDTIQAKFMYVIDLEQGFDNILREMDRKTRQAVQKNERMGVVLREGTREDIPLFADIMISTGERRNFKDRGEKFYYDMYDSFHDSKMISFVFAELDTIIARSKIEEERKKIEDARRDREEKRKQGNCNEKKAKAKEQEEESTLMRLNSREEELKTLEEKYGKKIPLGGILYTFYGGECASVFGGCFKEFREYQPFYTIHYEMIKKSCEEGYRRYNFYGINNHLEKEDSLYGIYQTKKAFGGHVIELLGEFILPVDKKVYELSKLWKKIKR